MATRSSKFLKVFNQVFYIASAAMLIAGMMLTLAVKPTMADSGSVWTNSDSNCSNEQNANAYSAGDKVYIHYKDFTPGTYDWSIRPPSSGSPNVAEGQETIASTDYGCFYAYTIGAADEGVYTYDLGKKNDNYHVCKVGQIFDGKKCVAAPVPAMTLTKSVDSAYPFTSVVGAVIHYNLVVTNTGETALTNISVVDPGAATLSCPATSLAIGAGMTCTATHNVTQGNIDNRTYTNIATATSAEFGPVTASTTVEFTQTPGIDVTKAETSTGPYKVGDTITYSIGVTNTGNVTLNNVSVSDVSAVVGACTPPNLTSSLAPNATMTCSATHLVTQADVDLGTYDNTATGASGNVSDSASVQVSFTQNPALDIDKTVTSTGPYIPGSTITYQIVATNIGNTTLHNVSIADNAATLGLACPTVSSPAASLAPGAPISCTASHIVSQTEFDSGSFVNTATADSTETAPVTDSATVNFVPGPAMSIDKSLDSAGPFILGSTIDYTIEVTNTGNVTLTNVQIADTGNAVGTCTPVQPATLAPNASMSCPATHVVTLADINAGAYTNTATGTSSQTLPVTDSVTVNFTPAPAIDVTKVAAPGTYALGDTISYLITATNTGNVTLSNVTISDSKEPIGPTSCVPAQGSSLDPLQTMVCSVSHVVTQSDVDAGSYENTATAQGTFGTTPYSDTDTETVPFVQTADFSITKTVTSTGPYDVNGLIVYSIVMTNTGTTTLHGITITDAKAVLGTCSTPLDPAPSLAPGQSITCSAGHTVDQGNFDAGIYINTAVGDAMETAPKSADAPVSFVLGPALALDKQETSTGPYVLGDTIHYTFVVSNIGNTTLSNVTVSDPGASIDLASCTVAVPATLAPAASFTCTGTHVVTAADITAGQALPTFIYSNTATADSTETAEVTDTVDSALAVKGCMDNTALNYNPAATIDDGSCVYPKPVSILDPYCGSGNYVDTMEWVVFNPNEVDFTVDYWTLDGNLQSGFIAPAGNGIFAHTALGTHTVVLHWGEVGQTSLTFTIASCSVPTQVPTDVPTDVPTEVPTRVPTVQPLPTLPIPATGGQAPVLIPVTGADLSGDFASRAIRGLIYGSFSCFGIGLVLTGLRRKLHL